MQYTKYMDYINIREKLYHIESAGSGGLIDNFKNYTKLLDSANSTKLFEIDHWDIGINGIPMITIDGIADLLIEKGKKVKTQILGINLIFENTVSQEIKLKKIFNIIRPARN